MLYKQNELGICIIIMYVDDMLIIGMKEQIQQFTDKIQIVGSHQVPFLMCTLETLQKYCSTGSLLLTFC